MLHSSNLQSLRESFVSLLLLLITAILIANSHYAEFVHRFVSLGSKIYLLVCIIVCTNVINFPYSLKYILSLSFPLFVSTNSRDK